MTNDTRIALFLMGELVAALRANNPDAFRGLLSEGMQELGVTEVEELLLDWLYSFLTAEEQDRLTGWQLGMSFNSDARGCGLRHILPFPRETFSEELLFLGVALS